MITAIDTNVLLDILILDPQHYLTSKQLLGPSLVLAMKATDRDEKVACMYQSTS